MRLRSWLLVGGLLGVASSAWSNDLSGRYRAQVEGVDTVLALQARGETLEGEYLEGALRFTVQGSLQGGTLRLSVREPASQLEIAQIEGPVQGQVFDAQIRARNPLTGQQRQTRARFVRDGAAVGAVPAPGDGALDARLVGTWVNEAMLGGSGGPNPGSFATVRTAQIGADGRFAQWVESAGGGGDWSYGSGRTLEFSGRWRAQDGVLYLHADGGAGFAAVTRYRFADPYLVTENDRGKLIWQRR